MHLCIEFSSCLFCANKTTTTTSGLTLGDSLQTQLSTNFWVSFSFQSGHNTKSEENGSQSHSHLRVATRGGGEWRVFANSLASGRQSNWQSFPIWVSSRVVVVVSIERTVRIHKIAHSSLLNPYYCVCNLIQSLQSLILDRIRRDRNGWKAESWLCFLCGWLANTNSLKCLLSNFICKFVAFVASPSICLLLLFLFLFNAKSMLKKSEWSLTPSARFHHHFLIILHWWRYFNNTNFNDGWNDNCYGYPLAIWGACSSWRD